MKNLLDLIRNLFYFCGKDTQYFFNVMFWLVMSRTLACSFYALLISEQQHGPSKNGHVLVGFEISLSPLLYGRGGEVVCNETGKLSDRDRLRMFTYHLTTSIL